MPLASAARRAPETDDINFTVSASIPPMVAGGVAGEMDMSVPHLYAKPGALCPTRYLGDRRREPVFLVRMQWWGDGGPGTVFKPGLLRERDEHGERARRTRLSKATRALFPVRCRLDGLLTYLKDMVRSDRVLLTCPTSVHCAATSWCLSKIVVACLKKWHCAVERTG